MSTILKSLSILVSILFFYNLSSSTPKKENILADYEFVVDIANTSVGEPIWSSVTVELLRVVVFMVCFCTVLALIAEWGEKRVLAFLAMVEVILVLLATLLVFSSVSAGFNVSSYHNTALCILAAGGADTAVALALFMVYYKITGKTTLK